MKQTVSNVCPFAITRYNLYKQAVKMEKEFIYQDVRFDVISRQKEADMLQGPPHCLWILPRGIQRSWSHAIHFGGKKCVDCTSRGSSKAGMALCLCLNLYFFHLRSRPDV